MKNMRIHSVLTLLALIVSMGLHAAAQTVKLTERFCEPTRLLVGCQVLDATGTYSVEVTPDSIVEVDLQIGVPEAKVEASIKKGETFLFGCETFTKEGVFPVHFTSSWGCDSVVNLYLSYMACDTARSNVNMSLCQKELPYTYMDVLQRQYVINSDSTIVARFPDMAASGCDSIATLSFKVYRVMENKKESAGICSGSYLDWRGQKLTQTGVYRDTVRYVATGCDSAYYEMNLTVAPLVTIQVTKNICESSLPYVYYGGKRNWRVYNDTIINDTVSRPSGCDSIAVVSIVVNRLKVDDVKDTTICEGSSFMWRGQNVDGSKAAYFDTIRYAMGCDSARYTLRVKVNRLMLDSKETKTICEGSFLSWRGQKLTEAKTYYDTVRYVATGCDSAYYQMTLTVEPLKYETKAITICQRQLPYYYKGQLRTYRIMGDSTFNDTVPSKVGAKCDSITTVTIMVEYPTVAPVEEVSVCPGEPVQWRGKVLSKPGTYRDTVRYVSGCDSMIFTIVVGEFPAMRQLVEETFCLADAQAAYPHLGITRSGDYADTLMSLQTGCDSIVTRRITILAAPAVPVLKNILSVTPLEVICGQPMDLQLVNLAVQSVIDQMNDPKRAKITSFWFEAMLTPTSTFTKVSDNLIPKGDGSIQLRLAVETECGETLYGMAVERAITIPNADNDAALDNLPAVKKYDNWLLMIHFAQITEMGYDIAEEDVTWYKIQGGEMDPIDQIKDDRIVGHGFYYTADQSLPGAYYAIIRDDSGDCGALLRTVVLNCQPKQKMALAPRTIRAGETMTLSNLNPDAATRMAIYYPDGKLIDQMDAEAVDSYLVQPSQSAGMYLLRVENGDQNESFKFIITQ